jgi:ubiquinone/menaquinone biosynthesis C-methylase UbiE
MSIETAQDPDAFAAFEQQGWEVVSHDYAYWFMPLTRQSVETLLDAACTEPPCRLLDVATGPGVVAAGAIARGVDTIGIDFAFEAVDIASRNVPQAYFEVGDAQAMSFNNASFDAVICAYGIMHMPNPDRALAEMYRVLRPGGRIAVSVWEAPGDENGFGLMYRSIRQHGKIETNDLPHGPDFFQFGTAEHLSEALASVGFTGCQVQRLAQYWYFDDPDQFITSFADATVRSRGLLAAQSPRARAEIYASVRDGLLAFSDDGESYQIPMPALIASANRP